MDNKNNFKAPWWLSNPHLQTLWGTLLRRTLRVHLRTERLELADDFLDLVWGGPKNDAPIVIILHGLSGSAESSYAMGMLHALVKQGLRGVLIQFRGCSGCSSEKVDCLPRAYHSGEAGDVAQVVNILHTREPHTPLYAVGFSLGGNVLLKWLGETGLQNPLRAAVAVSVPFELSKVADRLNTGVSRLYQWWLVSGLKRCHQCTFKGRPFEGRLKHLDKIKTFREFDDKITALLHGFESAQDYYARASSRQHLKSICIPTLIIQAKDDPFVPESALPFSSELSPSVTLQLSENGGHVGFVQGKSPWHPEYWLEDVAIGYLITHDKSYVRLPQVEMESVPELIE